MGGLAPKEECLLAQVYASRDYREHPLRILISGMNPCDEGFFLPIIYGMLKSFCDQYDDLREGCDWLEPIMLPETFDALDARYEFAQVDVLGISCYSWNHAYQYQLAAAVKAANPNCIVVAGGPHVEWKTADYFERYPYVDFAQPAEGEHAWRDMLRVVMAEFEGLDALKGCCINPRFGAHAYKVADPVDLAAKPSPWLTLRDFWLDYTARYAKYHLAACIETSRGCPYRCTYCDWGSKTNLRVRLIPEDIALAEIEFVVGTLKPWFMFWADANLGIVKRDVKLAERFAQCKKQSGFPLWLYYNNKNSYESNLAIAEAFRDAGLLTKYVLSLQHLDPDVLAAIGRTNLANDDIRKLVRRLYQIDYPIFTQLIAGCPGDTWEKWLGAFAELMELGVHGEYRAYPFGMFPNAPAADPDYQAKWGIRTIERPDSVAYFLLSTDELNEALSSSSYLMGASSYTSDEYERMWLCCWLIQAMHDHGLARWVAIALRAQGVASYAEFYRALFGWFFGEDGNGNPTGHTEMTRFAEPLKAHVHAWLTDPSVSFMMESPEAGGMLEPEEALCMQIMFDADYFYDCLERFVCETFGAPHDLLDYQRALMIRPDFEPVRDAIVRMPRRWVSYFAQVERDPFTLRAWPASPEEKSFEYGSYKVDTGSLQFPVKRWFERRGATRRRKAYYDQAIQHNVPGQRRAIFKKLAGEIAAENAYGVEGSAELRSAQPAIACA